MCLVCYLEFANVPLFFLTSKTFSKKMFQITNKSKSRRLGSLTVGGGLFLTQLQGLLRAIKGLIFWCRRFFPYLCPEEGA